MLDRREQSRALMDYAQQNETNAAVFPFKDGNGWLTYPSALMQMSLLRASQKARYRVPWTLNDLKSKAGQRIIGVVHCFDDPLAAELMPEAAVLQRNTGDLLWKDAQGRRWLNPYAQAAQEYLLAVIREVRAFGADDILLCGVQFPTGNLTAAAFAGEIAAADPSPQRNKVLKAFLAQAKEAVGEGRLYVVVPAQAALDGAPELGGTLWGSAADVYAIDVRDAPWAQNEAYWNAQPAVPLIADPGDAQGAREYLVMQEEAQS
jgi:hypothetical protein